MDLTLPTSDDVKAMRDRHGLTQPVLAELLHASIRTVQHWEAPEKSREHRQMPLAVWELALLKLGERNVDRSHSRAAKDRKARVRKGRTKVARIEGAEKTNRLEQLRRLAKSSAA